jgi:hypothetical protein
MTLAQSSVGSKTNEIGVIGEVLKSLGRTNHNRLCFTYSEKSITRYGITSLSPDEASPKRLLEIVRNHWHIENKSHWVRDVPF